MRLAVAALAAPVLLAAAPACAREAAESAVVADQRLVDRCNRAAAEGPLSGAEAAACSAAYERLLDHYGGYGAYAEARRARAEAETD